MRTSLLTCFAVSIAMWSVAASADRDTGWDFGGELIYQDSQDIDFDGGSHASLDSDVGVALAFGYRFNEKLELRFGLDWNTVDYDVAVVSDTGLSFTAEGDLESLTPFVGVNFNFMEGDITPYVTGAIGWAFIDTNIPDAPPQSGCWWDPWWGYICGTWQSTRSIDEFTYELGVGVRWDVSSSYSLRFGYEKHWLDLGEATSTPDFDQLRFAFLWRY